MELATVVVMPGTKELPCPDAAPQLVRPETSRAIFSSMTPILGNDVLRVWMDRVRKLGVSSLWLAGSSPDAEQASPALGGLAAQGVERLLLIRLKSYAEMDLTDLLRFHCETRSSVTSVHHGRGQLGVSVYERAALAAARAKSSHTVADRDSTPYPFHGYAKRILAARERQELIQDALTGACRMRPRGTGIREDVWVGEDVSLSDSVRLIGPSYIGDGTIVRAGATIGPFAAVERECEVDCGTTVECSTVLPHTYLAPGLLVRNALVDGEYLEDLSQGAIVDLRPGGLAARLQPRTTGDRVFAETVSNSRQKEVRSSWHLPPAPGEWRQVSL